jgi:hypothetical protein
MTRLDPLDLGLFYSSSGFFPIQTKQGSSLAEIWSSFKTGRAPPRLSLKRRNFIGIM